MDGIKLKITSEISPPFRVLLHQLEITESGKVWVRNGSAPKTLAFRTSSKIVLSNANSKKDKIKYLNLTKFVKKGRNSDLIPYSLDGLGPNFLQNESSQSSEIYLSP